MSLHTRRSRLPAEPLSAAAASSVPRWLLLLVLATLAPTLAADEVRLADGRVLVGPTTMTATHVRIETTAGLVVVPRDQVLHVRQDEELRAALAALAARAPDTPLARIDLARIARDFGLYPEMWARIDTLVEGPQLDAGAEQALQDFLAELEPVVLPIKWRDRPTEVRVRELLYRVRPGTGPGLRAAVVTLLAAEPQAQAALAERARHSGRPARRLCALRALAASDTETSTRFVYRTTIVDGARAVREGAAAMIRAHDAAADAVAYLASGLRHAHPTVRIRTAEAYADLRDPAAIDLLVEAAMHPAPLAAAGGGGSTRAHIAVLQHRSYVSDYDVEIAQAAFIANPQVSVLSSGVVLDVTVHAVITHRILGAYRTALRQLTGSDPGPDPALWAAWRRAQHHRAATTGRAAHSPPRTPGTGRDADAAR